MVNQSSYPKANDQRETVTTLLVRDLLLYGIPVNPEAILNVLHEVERVMGGKVWMRFDDDGHIIFYEGDVQSSPTSVKAVKQ